MFTIFSLIVSTAGADDLLKALGSALQEAEQNHSAKQVALEVDAHKIEEAKFRKYQNPTIVELSSVPQYDKSSFSTKDMADEIEVEDIVDSAAKEAISKEINEKE